MFLKIFDIGWNKPVIWSQEFAAEVTKLWPPGEIMWFEGSRLVKLPSTFCEKVLGSFTSRLYQQKFLLCSNHTVQQLNESPTLLQRKENYTTHYNVAAILDAGSMFPRPMCPRPKILGCCTPWVLFVPWINHPWPMCLLSEPHEGTGHNPTLRYTLATSRFALFAFSIGWRPSVRCNLCLHIITPSYRFAPLGDTPMIGVASLKVFFGTVRSSAQ